MATISPISKLKELAPSNPIEESIQSGKGPVSGSLLTGFQKPRPRILKPAGPAKAAETTLGPTRGTNDLSYQQAAEALGITQPPVVKPSSGSDLTKAKLISIALKSR